MGTNELILLKNQAAIEATRATDLPATRIVYADFSPSIERGLNHGVNRTGTFTPRRRAFYSRTKVGFAAVDEATFEDLPWWMQLAIKGGVVGVTDGGSPPGFAYTFVPTLSADDLKSIVLEWNESGNPFQSTQCMINSWTLRGDPDNDSESAWMFDAEIMARDAVPTTYTGALSDRTTEVILARGTKFYVDDTAGGIGGTQKLGSLISWSITGNNNLNFKAFSEDEQFVAANKVGRRERTHDAQITFEFENATELNNFLSSTPVFRAVRLEREGTIIHTTVRKRIRVDIFGYWSTWQRGDREGNLTATMTLQGFIAGGATTDISVAVVNALTSLP